MKTHYNKFLNGTNYTACGRFAGCDKYITRVRKLVTCKNCLRTQQLKKFRG